MANGLGQAGYARDEARGLKREKPALRGTCWTALASTGFPRIRMPFSGLGL